MNSNVKKLLAVAVTILMTATIFWLAFIYQSARNQADRYLTTSSLRNFGKSMLAYYSYYKHLPNGDTDKIGLILAGKNVGNQNPSNMVFWLPQKKRFSLTSAPCDAWGNRINVRYSSDCIYIWSNGENQKNESSQGDDLAICLSLPKP